MKNLKTFSLLLLIAGITSSGFSDSLAMEKKSEESAQLNTQTGQNSLDEEHPHNAVLKLYSQYTCTCPEGKELQSLTDAMAYIGFKNMKKNDKDLLDAVNICLQLLKPLNTEPNSIQIFATLSSIIRCQPFKKLSSLLAEVEQKYSNPDPHLLSLIEMRLYDNDKVPSSNPASHEPKENQASADHAAENIKHLYTQYYQEKDCNINAEELEKLKSGMTYLKSNKMRTDSYALLKAASDCLEWTSKNRDQLNNCVIFVAAKAFMSCMPFTNREEVLTEGKKLIYQMNPQIAQELHTCLYPPKN